MLCYCLKCGKNTESKNPKRMRTKNGRLILLSTIIRWLARGKIPILGSISLVNTYFKSIN